MADVHMVDEACLEPDDIGFFQPACVCGWKFGGVVPDVVEIIDALMEHAFQKGKS